MKVLRTFQVGNLPCYLTHFLPFSVRTEYSILAKIETTHIFSCFLMIVAYKSFVSELEQKIDFDLLLDIEAKRMGVEFKDSVLCFGGVV